MGARKLVVLTAAIVVVAVVLLVVPGNDTASSGIIHTCYSDATVSPGPHCMVIDPLGRGDRLDALGAVITVTVRDAVNLGVPNIIASDFWLIGAADNVNLCGGSASIDADSVTNENGQTTISAALRAGGCGLGVLVVVQGAVIIGPACSGLLILPITAVSPDIDGDLTVDTPDFALFAIEYPSPPKTYNACLDYNCDGDVELIDFTIFAQHYLIQC